MQHKGQVQYGPNQALREATLASPVRGVRTHGSTKQGSFICTLSPDRGESRAGDELQLQNRFKDDTLSLPSASMIASISDTHPPGGLLSSMPNPDGPLELEDDELMADPSIGSISRATRSWDLGRIHQLPNKRNTQSNATQSHFVNVNSPSRNVSHPPRKKKISSQYPSPSGNSPPPRPSLIVIPKRAPALGAHALELS
ncbi:hypothetical protein BDR04DRAFT_1233932 [Suillus decipiens]|nr:hypothetical protein BDR04DRAFT_1233932 [Suillus decipiens]